MLHFDSPVFRACLLVPFLSLFLVLFSEFVSGSLFWVVLLIFFPNFPNLFLNSPGFFLAEFFSSLFKHKGSCQNKTVCYEQVFETQKTCKNLCYNWDKRKSGIDSCIKSPITSPLPHLLRQQPEHNLSCKSGPISKA
jgi:hypothetical protein